MENNLGKPSVDTDVEQLKLLFCFWEYILVQSVSSENIHNKISTKNEHTLGAIP